MRPLILCFLGCLVLLAAACESPKSMRAKVRDDSSDRVSLGTVQREIRLGMPGGDVVRALGSPNIVTSDGEGGEVWVYDKVTTEKVTVRSDGGVWLIFPWVLDRGSATSTSQRTLTVIVKFDAENRVKDFSYRQSSF